MLQYFVVMLGMEEAQPLPTWTSQATINLLKDHTFALKKRVF
jgi:hypothetical protein